MQAPLSISFLGDRKTTVQVEADLSERYFESQGARSAFDHRCRVTLQADFRLECALRLSIKSDNAELLLNRLALADCEIVGRAYSLHVNRTRLVLRVDSAVLRDAGNWSLEEQSIDIAQAVRHDRTISALERIRGAQTRFYKEPLRIPETPCYLNVKLHVRDPLRMQVADRVEPVEDKAVISTGRPESNRRRFEIAAAERRAIER